MNQTLEQLKAEMKPEHVFELEVKLQQGEVIKSNIIKHKLAYESVYTFEFLIESRYDDSRKLIVGFYKPRRGITFKCDTNIFHLKALLQWAKSTK